MWQTVDKCRMMVDCGKQHRAQNIRLLRMSYASQICKKSCFAVSETFLSGWYTKASFLKLQQAEKPGQAGKLACCVKHSLRFLHFNIGGTPATYEVVNRAVEHTGQRCTKGI